MARRGAVGVEDEPVGSAVGGRVLVLLADGLAHDLDFDAAGFAGEPFGGDQFVSVGVKGVEQGDGDGTGAAQPRTRRRDVGQGGDLHAAGHAGQPHGLPNQVVLNVRHAFHALLAGVVDVDHVVETLFDDGEDEFVNGRGDHLPRAVLIICGHVRAAADKTDAQGGLDDDHESSRTVPVHCGGGL